MTDKSFNTTVKAVLPLKVLKKEINYILSTDCAQHHVVVCVNSSSRPARGYGAGGTDQNNQQISLVPGQLHSDVH